MTNDNNSVTIKNNSMNSIKFLSEKRIRLNGKVYKPYLIGDLPPSFGTRYKINFNGDGTEDVLDGIYEWFNFKGLTYIKE